MQYLSTKRRCRDTANLHALPLSYHHWLAISRQDVRAKWCRDLNMSWPVVASSLDLASSIYQSPILDHSHHILDHHYTCRSHLLHHSRHHRHSGRYHRRIDDADYCPLDL